MYITRPIGIKNFISIYLLRLIKINDKITVLIEVAYHLVENMLLAIFLSPYIYAVL